MKFDGEPSSTGSRTCAGTLAWTPDKQLIDQIALHNIPPEFTNTCVVHFAALIKDGMQSSTVRVHFIKYVLQQWHRHGHVTTNSLSMAGPPSVAIRKIDLHWRPDTYVIETLLNLSRISRHFVEDAIPEFCIYWQERDEASEQWNSKFVRHVKRQWFRYTALTERSVNPQPICKDWRPSEDVMSILRIANVDVDFAKSKVDEFILFWSESKRAYPSWNTKFLQHVKYLWAIKHQDSNARYRARASNSKYVRDANDDIRRSTRDISILDQLSDRSWANDIIRRV